MKINYQIIKYPLALATGLIIGAYFFNMRPPIDMILELVHETEFESGLESKINKSVYLDVYDDPDKRDHFLKNFEKNYSRARSNWDNFDRQFGDVSFVRAMTSSEYDGGDINGSYDLMGCVRFYAEFYHDDVFIHELAHSWTGHNTDIFDDWKVITRNYYIEDWQNAEHADLVANGAVSYYGLKNVLEDIAETAQLVYCINNPNINVGSLQDDQNHFREPLSEGVRSVSYPIQVEAVGKIEQKIQLLSKYEFISQREAKRAIDVLSNF